MDAPVLAVAGLRKSYRGQEALAGVDLEVGAGELVGLLGPERRRQVDADEDRLRPGAAERRPRRGARRAGRLAAGPRRARLPGGAVPLPGLVLRRRAAAPAPAARRLRRRRRASGRELLELVGLGDAAGKRVEAMSKGMQQRLGIAQALVGSPRLLLLDEPTSALDPVGRRIVRDLLEELRGRGVAVLLNSHLLSEVELVCDRVAIIARGKLVKAGTPGGARRPGGVEVETESGVRVFEGAGREEAPRIVAELVAAGERVYRVEVRHSSLEEVYLEAVGGQTG